MALEERYANAEDIPESLKDHYVEFEENGEKQYVLENVVGALKAKANVKSEYQQRLDREIEEKKTMQERLDSLQRAEDERKKELEDARRKSLEKEGNLDELRKIDEEKRENERKAYEARIAELEEKHTNLVVEREREKVFGICTSVASMVGIAGDNGTIEPLTKLIEVTRTKTVNGQVVILNKEGQAVEWTSKQLAEDIKTDPFFANLVAGSKASGGGAHGGGGGGASYDGKGWSELTPEQKKDKIEKQLKRG